MGQDYNSNEDKSRTVVCEGCGSMVHHDYMVEHDDFHSTINEMIESLTGLLSKPGP